jgi:PPP family 3-phenylpropionic acid transporter
MERVRLQPKELALRLAVFYAALFLVYGMHVPYLPVWLDARGLSEGEIAFVTAAPFFLRLFTTPALALHADHSASHRRMVVVSSVLALAAVLLLSAAEGFWWVLVTALPFALATSGIMPLTEAMAVKGARSEAMHYGRVRLWGSLSFVVMGLAGGAAVDRLGASVIIWLLIAGTAMTAAAATFLPGGAEAQEPDRPSRIEKPPVTSEALGLLRSRVFLFFLVGAGAVQGAHATFYTFGALHWRSQGLSAVWCGVLWAVAVLSEVCLFAWADRLGARLKEPASLLMWGAGAAVLRWLVMAFDPPLAVLIPLQTLHGLTYGASHLGAILFLGRAVPPAVAGTAQALYATMAAGIVMGAATLSAGPLYERFQGRAYLAALALASAGLVALLLLVRSWDGGTLSHPHRG